MEHYLDIETVLFEKIKEHETTKMRIPPCINKKEVRMGDTLKLYHPGDETEALRVEIVNIEKPEIRKIEIEEMSCFPKKEGEIEKTGREQEVVISFSLLEWMCRLETELDELLRQEEMWMQELL